MTAALREIDRGLDDNANAFVTQFVGHIAALVGGRADRLEIITSAKRQLLAALAPGSAPDHSAWRALYHTVRGVVETRTGDDASASAYLQAFLHENSDLD